MRDAIGSTFMIRIFIIFIVFYIVFMCFAVSYAKTFRLKNNVINVLEQSQYQGENDSAVLNEIKDYMSDNAYHFGDKSSVIRHCQSVGADVSVPSDNILTKTNGVCITSVGTGDERYYKVYLYIVFTFPVFNMEFVIPVGSETEVIPEYSFQNRLVIVVKDAFGGTFMIKVLMVFFVVYIVFMSIAINYAKAFRIKNNVINILEKPIYSNNYEGAITEINSYLSQADVAYNYNGDQRIVDDCNERGGSLDFVGENNGVSGNWRGVCIVTVQDRCTNDGDGNLVKCDVHYYRVTSYFVLKAPLFNIEILAPIIGETKIIAQ